MEKVIVLTLGAASILYIGRTIIRSLGLKEKPDCGCGACDKK